MAKGTYRLKRLAVLEELEGYDAEWAQQIRDLRTTNPQAYRKELLKADIVLSASTGRKLKLSMRPKRFGGDEDPVLVRRVLALRKAFPELTRGVDMAPIFGRPTPFFEEQDVGSAEGWTQERTPHMDETDRGPVDGWTQERTPHFEESDRGSVDGWTQDRTPKLEDTDLGSVEGWTQQRTPNLDDGNLGRTAGAAPRGRAPEVADRPDEDLGAPKPPTRQAEERERPIRSRELGDLAGAGLQRMAAKARRKPAPAQAEPAPKAAKPKAAKPKAKPAVAASSSADLSILKGTISAFKKALATGEHDAHLDALEAAEKAGKGRKGVLTAISGRR